MAEKGKSRGFNLDSIVQKLQEEGSPPPSSGTDSDLLSTSTGTMVKTGASRRKPTKVVRQVASDEESDPPGTESNDDIESSVSQGIQSAKIEDSTNNADAVLEAMRKATKDQQEVREEKKEAVVQKTKTPPATPRTKGNKDAAPEELPEGTVIVEPEAVVDDRGVFRGPEFSRKHKREAEAGATPTTKITVGSVDQIYHCTACGGQIFPSLPGTCKRHPALKVLICKRCYNYYRSDNFDKDENGIDEQCRWCAEGGNLLCCDFCTNAFCKACIKRNLGRRELTEINDSDEWRCYMCDPFHLSDLISTCDQVMEVSEQERQKQKRISKAKKEESAKKQAQGKESQDDSDDVQVVSEIKGTPKPVEPVKVEIAPQPITVPIDPSKRMTLAQIRQLPLEQQQEMLRRPDRRYGKRNSPVIGQPQPVMQQSRPLVSQPVVYASPVVPAPGVNVVRAPSLVVTPDFSSTSHNILTSVLHMHTFLESLQQRHAYLTGKNATKTNYLLFNQAQPVLTDALKEQLKKAQPLINSAVQKIATIQKIAQELLDQDPQGIPVSPVGAVPVGVVSADQLANSTTNANDDKPASDVADVDLTDGDVQPVQNGIAGDDIEDGTKDSDVPDDEAKSATKRKLAFENKSEDAKRSKQGKNSSADEAESATDKDGEKRQLRGKGKADRTEEDVASEAALRAAMMDESTEMDSESENNDSGEEYSPSKRKSKSNSETPNSSQKRSRVQKTTPKRASRTSMASDEDETSESNEPRRSLRSRKQEADSTTKSPRKGRKKRQDDSDLSDTDKEISDLEKKALRSKGSSKKKRKEEDSEEENEEDDKKGKGTKKEKKEEENEEDDKKGKSIKKEKKGGKKDKKERKKKSDKDDSSSSDGNNTGDDDGVDDDEEGYHSEDMFAEGDGDLNDGAAGNDDTDDENPENAAAKKKLLADMDDDEDSSSENSDSAKKKEKKTRKKKEVAEKKAKEGESGTDEDEEEEILPKKKSRKQHPLLRIRLESSDTDGSKKSARKRKRAASKKSSQSSGDGSSGSDDGSSTAGVSRRTRSKKTVTDEDNDSRSYRKGKGKKKRRRIKIDDSDSEASQHSSEYSGSEGDKKKKKESRKKIRKVWDDKKLKDETKQAAKAEEERRKRLASRQEEGEGVFQVEQVEIDESSPVKCPITTRLILEKDPKTKSPLIEVDRRLCRKLKPHQVEGVRFLWDSLYETVEKGNKEEGSGAILAHCMGLGKTLQVVTLVHTVIMSDALPDIKTCLVVCPINTVLNWKKEFEMWLDEEDQLDVWELASITSNQTRKYTLEAWQREGGVMLMGYDMFRNLSTGKRIKSKKMRESFHTTLVEPGPDIVVCDEGHILKNEATAISKAMNDIKTKRRIVLTGTPLQNNLTEYHCMVNFVKPNLLGTKKEFCNRFANPISNGQASDSTQYDVKLMKRRAHILHQLLAGCVQRRDYSALTKFLSPKAEYVIKVRLGPLQIQLYEHFLNNATRAENIALILLPSPSSLVFSQSLLSLDLIEDFLEYLDGLAQSEDPKADTWMNGKYGWGRNLDYFRMDGSTSAQLRERWAEIFNSTDNERARLFLISTRAGGLGINLVGANRVIIFDASWNPSHDVQSIFRVYRFGQNKPVFVYRFLAQGTMEEKIYDRQVTKQSLSARVVDEHQIERHFTMGELAELYNFTPDRLDDPNRQERPTPKLPVDLILADLLQSQKDFIVDYHEHDSLLENQEDETLTEEERKAAWEEYENEKKGIWQRRGPYQDPRLQGFTQMNNFQMEQRMREMQAAIQAGHQVSGTSLHAFNYGQQLGVQMDMARQITMERAQPQPVMSLAEIILDQQKRYPHLSRDALAQRAVYIQEQQKKQVQMHEERIAAIRRYEALCQQQHAAVQALVHPQKATGDPSKILASFIAETQGLKHQAGPPKSVAAMLAGGAKLSLQTPKPAKPGTLAAMIQESRRNGSANMQQPSSSRIDDDAVIILDSPDKN
ncbi:PREDICTED: transcriptional regulator ATRX-like [Branchiostoma belcheri]|uniref:DNA helicase n=1 Tax=Branchiostoma belcheri TaxID=7741 RepID=A0A6P4XY77_BRABE|nr:PREDICTED: transcriptional regulator ATRX-like [Branchiostoma belcheri]